MNSRVLRGSIRAVFEEPSPVRERIASYVREHLNGGTRSVALCFRGNAATLYYRCHRLLTLRSSRAGIAGEFDFRHAHFSGDHVRTLERLRGLHVDTSRCYGGGHAAQNVLFPLEACTMSEFGEIPEIYRGLIDDFFDPEKTEYAFGAPAAKRGKTAYPEKERQQLWASCFLKDDLTYYDLEYAEPSAVQQGLHGRFDLLGVRREPEGYTLLLTELKSTPQALWGRSGPEAHERDYLGYLNSLLVAARKEEACETVRLLRKIFGRPCPEDLTPANIRSAKIRFVFSDKVIGAGRAYRPSDDRIEKAFLDNEK